ncbi:MAG: hypothetical protein ABSG51_15030 [Terracidiphilus sp.]
MTKRNFPLFPAVVVAVTLASVGSGAAQDKRVPLCSDDANGTCNGISVGRPKVFDNHTLSLMIDGLTQTLTKMQSFMDQKSVAGAIANTQGSSQTDTTTSVNLTVNPGGTPAAPTLDAAATPPSFNPGYGQSASDLLTDQVNLTYQLFNLQMILDRALSDRLCKEEETCPQRKEQDNRTRLQAVLGFNVTIDPPRAATDAAAVVEITLSSKTGPLSLVTMMPQEKTYNASAFSSKSNAFGGAAAAGTVQVGGSARKKSQIFYLYRDNDTLSYERMTADAKTVVFGWMFRPVLGRRSVSPGLRQLFAVLALPSQDCAASAGAKVAECTATISSKMRTYWKQYDRKTLTSFERRDANRASEFLYGVSMGMAKPQIFSDPRYLYAQPVADDIDVPSTSDYQSGLQPKVNAVTWRPAGNKNIIVSARGMNFFYGTKVLLGDKAYSESPAAGESAGLTLKSDQAFDLMTTLDALVAGPGIVLGRYDNSVPLTNPANQFHFRDEARGSGDEQPTGFLNGFEMANVVLTPSITGLRKIQVYLRRKLCAGKPDAADAYCLTEAKNESTLEAEVRDALAKVSARRGGAGSERDGGRKKKHTRAAGAGRQGCGRPGEGAW